MNRDLREVLQDPFQTRGASSVITSERSQKISAAVVVNLFTHWYRTQDLNRRRLT